MEGEIPHRTKQEKMAPSTCPLLVESQALIDALGYIDTEYNDANAQRAVQQLIRAEMTKFTPSPTYLEFLPDYSPSFPDHPRLQNEYRRVKANVPLNAIDLNRYQVREPTGTHEKDVTAWETAVRKLATNVEVQSDRVMNLELQQAYASKMWKVRAAVLEGVTAQYEKALNDVKEASEAVNVQRKQDQTLNAPKLAAYAHKIDQLQQKNASIKRACEDQERRTSAKRAKLDPKKDEEEPTS